MLLTVNEVLVLERAVRERLNDLKNLRQQVSLRTTHYRSGNERTEQTPEFDPKGIEAKIAELQTFLLTADRRIKISNAKTEVDVNFDADKLLAPMQ